MNNTVTLTIIPEVQFGFDAQRAYEFEEIEFPFNEETETVRAIYGDDFRG